MRERKYVSPRRGNRIDFTEQTLKQMKYFASLRMRHYYGRLALMLRIRRNGSLTGEKTKEEVQMYHFELEVVDWLQYRLDSFDN